MKICILSGHEIKSLNALLECNIRDLHLPMMVILDYYGYRLIAQSSLPLNKRTICYGSNDGGRTVYNSNETFERLIANACEKIFQ